VDDANAELARTHRYTRSGACHRGNDLRHSSVSVPVAAKPASQTGAATSEPSARLALPDRPSIAVLAFQNMSGDPEQEYFADGTVEEIITGLSRIKWLFVIARNSSFIYKGKPDVRQVGRELGVRYVLEALRSRYHAGSKRRDEIADRASNAGPRAGQCRTHRHVSKG